MITAALTCYMILLCPPWLKEKLSLSLDVVNIFYKFWWNEELTLFKQNGYWRR